MALACSILFIALFIALWTMIQHNTLDKAFSPSEKGRHFFFVKESFYVDSAVIYNNAGVDTFYGNGSGAEALFRKAIAYDSGLPRADTNLLKLYYNQGIQQYRVFQNGDSTAAPGEESLRQAQSFFQQAVPLPDALHALGVTQYLLNDTSSARQRYEQLLVQTDSLFFDTTSVFPNLESLLFPKRPPEIRDVKITPARNGGLDVMVTYFPNERLYPQLSLEAVPLQANGKIPKGMTPVAKVLMAGQAQTLLTTQPPNNLNTPISTASVRIRLRSTGGYVVDERTVPYNYEWKKPETPILKKELPNRAIDSMPLEQRPPIDPTIQQSNPPIVQQRPVIRPILPEMVRVEGGTFMMGCNPKDKKMRKEPCQEEAQPPHEVTLSSYSIGKYEVTNEEFVLFLNDRERLETGGVKLFEPGCEIEEKDGIFQAVAGKDKNPATCVTWYGADAYAAWLNDKTPGAKFRLPTEAEWEFAARGGQKGWRDNLLFAGSDILLEVGWYSNNSKGDAMPVGNKSDNQLGLHDMSGNVWEWCADWYGAYSGKPAQAPKGAAGGLYHVVRGGSWDSDERACIVSARSFSLPESGDKIIGFRLCRD